jgi:hypothetical protein
VEDVSLLKTPPRRVKGLKYPTIAVFWP